MIKVTITNDNGDASAREISIEDYLERAINEEDAWYDLEQMAMGNTVFHHDEDLSYAYRAADVFNLANYDR